MTPIRIFFRQLVRRGRELHVLAVFNTGESLTRNKRKGVTEITVYNERSQ